MALQDIVGAVIDGGKIVADLAGIGGKKAEVKPKKEDDRCGQSMKIDIPDSDNWCSEDAIHKVDANLAKGFAGDNGWMFRNLFGFEKAGGLIASLPDWACLLFGKKPGKIGIFVVACVYVIVQFADEILNAVIPKACSGKGMVPLLLKSSLMGVAERWIGTNFGPARRNLANTMNYSCPEVQPFTHDVIAAVMHNKMIEKDCIAWCRSHGWCDFTTELALDAARWRYSPGFVVQMFYRGCIPVKSEAMKELRKLGVINVTEQENLIECSRPLISVETSINWYWMLRKGRAFGDLVYTKQEAIADITKHGYTDLQARRFIEASRAVIGVRHILQPYYQGKMSFEEVEARLGDSRWREEDVAEIKQFYDFEKCRHTADHVGIPISSTVVNETAEGRMTEAEMIDQLSYRCYGPAIIQAAAREVNMRRASHARRTAISNVRRMLESGETNVIGAVETMAALGVPGDEAQLIVAQWLAERDAKAKPVSLGQLCEWFNNGWISYNYYVFGLQNLGYGPADIKRIIAACDLKERVRQDKEAERKFKEQERERVKAEKAKAAADKAAAKNKTTPAQDPVSGRFLAASTPSAERLAAEGHSEKLSEIATEIQQLSPQNPADSET